MQDKFAATSKRHMEAMLKMPVLSYAKQLLKSLTRLFKGLTKGHIWALKGPYMQESTGGSKENERKVRIAGNRLKSYRVRRYHEKIRTH